MMNAKIAVGLGIVLLVIAFLLVLVVVLDLLPLILLALGLVLFVILLTSLFIGAIVLLVAVPYYLTTKPARVTPRSTTTLERMREP